MRPWPVGGGGWCAPPQKKQTTRSYYRTKFFINLSDFYEFQKFPSIAIYRHSRYTATKCDGQIVASCVGLTYVTEHFVTPFQEHCVITSEVIASVLTEGHVFRYVHF